MRTCSSAYVIIIPMILVFIFRGPEELHQQKQSKFMPQKKPCRNNSNTLHRYNILHFES